MFVRTRILCGAAVLALAVGACSGGAGPIPTAAPTPAPSATPTPTPKPVTIEWWQLNAAVPDSSFWSDAAKAYMTAHPNVTIKITVMDGLKTRLTQAGAAGTPPDLFPSWGGADLSDQVKAGMVRDITSLVAPWGGTISESAMSVYRVDGKQYGVPWEMGLVGMFYNKTLFARAGIANVPATWDELMTDVDKLKAAKIYPYAIAGKDEWPGMHLWSYLVLRAGGRDTLTQMISSGNWNTDACVQGGTLLRNFAARDPFQPGWPTAFVDKGEGAAMGNGIAAMELMGQWGKGVEEYNSKSGKGIGDALGWFPFPTVSGGKGDPNDGVGGGDGFVVGKNAPDEAVDFLHFLSTPDRANKIGSQYEGMPVVAGTEGSVADPLVRQILVARNSSSYIQVYLDQATRADVGTVINHETAALIAGKTTPAKVCQAITDAATAH